MDFDQRMAKMAKQLAARKQRGAKYAIRTLTPRQREYVEGILGYPTSEYLYEITPRKITSLENAPGIVKEVHFRFKAGKKICKPLRPKDQVALSRYKIPYRPLKFKIVLEEKE